MTGMDDLVSWLIWSFLGGVALGYAVDSARERAFWRRQAIRVFTTHPMSTQLPTVTELNAPSWERTDG